MKTEKKSTGRRSGGGSERRPAFRDESPRRPEPDMRITTNQAEATRGSAQNRTRVFGIVRVSEKGNRDEKNLHSDKEQLEQIRRECEREGAELIQHENEMDKSGKLPLSRREHLLAAVEAVEAGEVDAIVVAYFDRLVRNLSVQREVVQRVEAAGGRVKALDFGEVSEATASQWLSGTMIGMMAEYYVRIGTEKSAAAQTRAVNEGKHLGNPPWGYGQVDGFLVPNEWAPIVHEAFLKAAFGIHAAQDYLREAAPQKPWQMDKVRRLLTNRTYLGEVHFGKQEDGTYRLVCKKAHPPIVTRREFEAAQPEVTKRRRRGRAFPLSGIATCTSCDGHLVGSCTGLAGERAYVCRNEGCPGAVVITANRLEEYCRAVLRQEWDEHFTDAALLPANAQELQDRLEEEEDDVTAFAVDPKSRSELGDQYHPILQAKVQARDRTREAFRAVAKEPSEPFSSDGLADDASPEELGRLLANCFALISVRRGRLPIEQRVTLNLHGSDEPVTLAQDVQGDTLKAAS